MQNERSFVLSIDQTDGFGLGGAFTRKQIHALLTSDGYSEFEIDNIIDKGGIKNEYHTVTIEPVVLLC